MLRFQNLNELDILRVKTHSVITQQTQQLTNEPPRQHANSYKLKTPPCRCEINGMIAVSFVQLYSILTTLARMPT